MAKKKAFALRVNEDMIKAIEKWAADEFRSTNGQIEWMLMQALKEAKREPKKRKNNFRGVTFQVALSLLAFLSFL
ncbi:Arc family DNA binding domain-containing protein [Polaribacter ponticola]|uniref:Arc family DNA binding domain-containing protein n=1 Tax=Polaribacter ponticola TaxID=2978475 RepID=A0ABT5S8F1_9FLAO|nr:Arc family DNA binding domain-containing protein [Polaribacter sp. MSW5]MDD7914378.1 Arc family DNA binding domain-containing protein [Polaribacter sp. MSW5]